MTLTASLSNRPGCDFDNPPILKMSKILKNISFPKNL